MSLWRSPFSKKTPQKKGEQAQIEMGADAFSEEIRDAFKFPLNHKYSFGSSEKFAFQWNCKGIEQKSYRLQRAMYGPTLEFYRIHKLVASIKGCQFFNHSRIIQVGQPSNNQDGGPTSDLEPIRILTPNGPRFYDFITLTQC